jgi:hypothetical protein
MSRRASGTHHAPCRCHIYPVLDNSDITFNSVTLCHLHSIQEPTWGYIIFQGICKLKGSRFLTGLRWTYDWHVWSPFCASCLYHISIVKHHCTSLGSIWFSFSLMISNIRQVGFVIELKFVRKTIFQNFTLADVHCAHNFVVCDFAKCNKVYFKKLRWYWSLLKCLIFTYTSMRFGSLRGNTDFEKLRWHRSLPKCLIFTPRFASVRFVATLPPTLLNVFASS